MKNHVFKIGVIVYIVLAMLALAFYIERTAFLDISFHLFYILKDNSFAIQNNRFGAWMTQLFPLIGSKMGLSLNNLMKLYSVGFILYYFSIFFIITKHLKSYQFGLVMLLFSTVMVTDTFYWIQSELPQGIAFMVLYFGILHSIQQKKYFTEWLLIPVLASMLVTIAFFHPLLVFPFLFCSIFLYIYFQSIRGYLKGGFLFYIILLIIKSLFFKTTYDSNAMAGVNNFINLFPDYIFLASNKQFLIDIGQKFYMLILGLLVVLFYYIKNRNFIKAFLIASFFYLLPATCQYLISQWRGIILYRKPVSTFKYFHRTSVRIRVQD